MRLRTTPLVLAFLVPALLPVAGCGSSSEPPLAIVAIDASGSAREFYPAFERAARDVNESIPPGGRLEVYRFDRTANEIYAGEPLDASGFKRTLIRALAPKRRERGTSLLVLVRKLENSVLNTSLAPIDLTILTDCGVEGMTKAEHDEVRKNVAAWTRVRKCEFIGLRPLHHDTIRSDFASLGTKLTIR